MKLNVSGTKKMLINRLVNAPEDLKTDSGVVVQWYDITNVLH